MSQTKRNRTTQSATEHQDGAWTTVRHCKAKTRCKCLKMTKPNAYSWMHVARCRIKF